MRNLVLLALVSVLLTGCFTELAQHEFQGDKEKPVFSDVVTSVGAGTSSDRKTGWIFVGKNHTYLLSAGADNFMSALVRSRHIDKNLLTPVAGGLIAVSAHEKLAVCPSASGTFIVNDQDASQFSGCLAVLYKKQVVSVDELNELKRIGFQRVAADTYLLKLDLSGSIHAPVKLTRDFRKLIGLPHPVAVSFVRTGKSLFQSAALGAAAAADIITSPIQVLGTTAFAGYAAYRLSR